MVFHWSQLDIYAIALVLRIYVCCYNKRVFIKSDVSHMEEQCVNAFHCFLSPPAHSRIRTWSHIHTWLCTLTHAHTCTQSWLLKVLTWAMPLCQLFPVGRLSTCLIFHACAEFLCLSKLTVDADFIVSNKVFPLNPAPTHTILFQRAPLIMQHIIQSWVHTC